MPKAKPRKPISNPTASTKTDPKVEQILATPRAHWEMGRKISQGKLTPKAFAIEHRINERTVRDRRAFYQAYESKNEFQRCCKLRLNNSKRPLNSSYIKYLLTIDDKIKGFVKSPADTRYAFAELAAKNDLSPAQFHDLIKRECGRPISSNGRKFRPRDKATAIEDVAREAVKWIKRCEVVIELVPSTEVEDQRLFSLLKNFNMWVLKAVKLCEVPKVNEKKAESISKNMKQSLERILELFSTCDAPLKGKKA